MNGISEEDSALMPVIGLAVLAGTAASDLRRRPQVSWLRVVPFASIPFMASVRHGFYWWELDATFYLLRAPSWFGIVRDLRYPSQSIMNAARHGPVAQMDRATVS
jgi:hypothetical protein